MALYGRQAIVELHGCNARTLDDAAALKEIMIRAAQASRAHIVEVVSHKFSPQGASVVVVIAESHMSIHTWPEHRFAAVDIFTCSSELDLSVAWQEIGRGVEAREVMCKVLPRLHEDGDARETDGARPLHLLITKDSTLLKVTEVVDRLRTRWQNLEIVRTANHGLCLLLDQTPQSSEADEFIYHEALVHPALLAHPNPRRVLILGGGEGATAREVLRHPSVERVVMVDLDGEVVDYFRRNLPQWHQGSFSDPRLEVVVDDGRSYVERSREGFDCVIVDLTDVFPLTPASKLYSREFYRMVQGRIGPEGILATHAEGTGPAMLGNHLRVIATLRAVFPQVIPYRAFIPVFGQEWGFGLAGPAKALAALDEATVDRRLAERGIASLRFYDGATHRALVTLPKHLRQALERRQEPLTDAEINALIARTEAVLL